MQGGCHCGAVRYEVAGDAFATSLCHCGDCRRHSGAPMVAWGMFRTEQVRMTRGQAKLYASSEHGRRFFCADCGTGLFYQNAVNLPGITDVQTGTLDDPAALPPGVQVQMAERLDWLDQVTALPAHDRYPSL